MTLSLNKKSIYTLVLSLFIFSGCYANEEEPEPKEPDTTLTDKVESEAMDASPDALFVSENNETNESKTTNNFVLQHHIHITNEMSKAYIEIIARSLPNLNNVTFSLENDIDVVMVSKIFLKYHEQEIEWD
jgi:hypothetical protein